MKQLFKSLRDPNLNSSTKKTSRQSSATQNSNKNKSSKPRGLSTLLKKGEKKSLGDYIKRQKWKKVDQILFNKGPNRKILIGSVEEETGIPCLSLVCMMHPPICIVIKFVNFYPDKVSQRDENGRYPLHFAAGWGASPQVVSFLTAMNSDIAAEKDRHNKTPLIMACEHMHPLRLSDTGNSLCEQIRGPTIEVVEVLVAAAFHTVSDEDGGNMNALDYCKKQKTTDTVLKFLKQATSIDLRIKAEMHENHKRPKFRKPGQKEKLKHDYATIWDGLEFTTKASIREEREMNKRLIDFLNIDDEREIIRDLDVKFLKKNYSHALHAAENGYLSCARGFTSDTSLPSLVDVYLRGTEDISDCTINF